MPAEPSTGGQSRSLTAEDLGAAVRLINEGTSHGPTDWRGLALSLFGYAAGGGGIFGLIVGLVVVWFDSRLGVALLVGAGAGLAVLGVLTKLRPELVDTERRGAIRAQLQNSAIGQASASVWRTRSFRSNLVMGIAIIIALSLVLCGFGWLAYGLVTKGQVWGWPIVLVFAGVLPTFLLSAVSNYYLYRYLSRVAQLRPVFEQRFERAVAASEPVEVSQQEISVLADLEISQNRQQVAQAIAQLPKVRTSFYGVVIDSELQDYLARLPEDRRDERQAAREAADMLQFDPHPIQSSQAPGQTDVRMMQAASCDVFYRVDDEKERVVITAVRRGGESGGANAS